MRVAVDVHLKRGVLDPQGKAVHHALENLGFSRVKDVRVGKQIIVEVEAETPEEALDMVRKMADKLLANPVIENYKLELLQ
ncbi:MAG: phosphoribosylformylglycinamidine synthase subunit PurS [Campylobacterales bacterium]